MTRLQQQAIDLVTLRQGIKARDLTTKLAGEFTNMTNEQVIQEVIDLVTQGYLIEVEYVLSAKQYGVEVSRSFLVPKDTAININNFRMITG